MSVSEVIDVRSWEGERSLWLHPGATTSRFFIHDDYSDKEMAFVVWPKVTEAQAAWRKGLKDQAWTILRRIETNFPRMCGKFPEFLRLMAMLAVETNDLGTLRTCQANLEKLVMQEKSYASFPRMLRRYLLWGFPLAMELKRAWERKHRIPRKLMDIARRFASGRKES